MRNGRLNFFKLRTILHEVKTVKILHFPRSLKKLRNCAVVATLRSYLPKQVRNLSGSKSVLEFENQNDFNHLPDLDIVGFLLKMTSVLLPSFGQCGQSFLRLYQSTHIFFIRNSFMRN